MDLSILIENSKSEPMKISIKRISHKRGARRVAFRSCFKIEKSFIKKFFKFCSFMVGNKKIKHTDFPNGEFITNDTVTLCTHMGTHIDAPIHFGSLCGGKPAKAIHELPIEMFYSNAVRLDLRFKASGQLISQNDIKQCLFKINYELKNNDIVLLWTDSDKKFGTIDYFLNHPGMSKEATEFLINKGVKVIGTDAYSFDRPIGHMIRDFMNTQDNRVLWPAHFYGREKEYVHIERLANLDLLPDKDFKICCFPIKIKNADASWSRVVAILD